MTLEGRRYWLVVTGALVGWVACFAISMVVCPATPLDMKFMFSSENAVEHLNKLGEVGVAQCRAGWWVDMVYPLTYATLFGLLMWGMGKKRGSTHPWWLLPWVGALLDYAENACLYPVLQSWPDLSEVQDALWLTGHLLTPAKWIVAGFSLVVMLAMAISRVRQLRAGRQ